MSAESFSRTYRDVDEEMLREDLFNEARRGRERPLNPPQDVKMTRTYDLNKEKPTFNTPNVNPMHVNTASKRKADSVRPVDTDERDCSKPGWVPDWRERAEAREEAAGVGSREH